ncbi:hypothetical protein N7528_005435 [Penicillium herquei]|nr:hypothetical protein N7528_005435 [Penicillium herquei]
MAAKKSPSEEKESEQPCQRCLLRLITTPDHICMRRGALKRCVYCSEGNKECKPVSSLVPSSQRTIQPWKLTALLIPRELREEAQRAMQGPKCQLAERVREVRRKIVRRTRRINMETRIEAAEASSEKDPDVKEEGDTMGIERLFEMAVDNADDSEESDLSELSDLHDIPHFSDESGGPYESDEFYDAAAEKQLQDSLAEAAQANIEIPQVASLESLEEWERDDRWS